VTTAELDAACLRSAAVFLVLADYCCNQIALNLLNAQSRFLASYGPVVRRQCWLSFVYVLRPS